MKSRIHLSMMKMDKSVGKNQKKLKKLQKDLKIKILEEKL